MALCRSGESYYLDFAAPQILYRLKHASLRRETLARAIGMAPKDHPRIVDATAGLGRDSLVLAALGYTITLIEQSPLIFALLSDACERAKEEPFLQPIVSRMQLVEASAEDWLSKLEAADYPDVIYLDPMFPERRKSAAVKKESKFLQDIVGLPVNMDKLLEVADKYAKKRVVVKRPTSSNHLAEKTPDFSLVGKACRFDVYLAPVYTR